MKYLIVSDIHGSAPRLAKVLEHYRNGGYDLLLILGDILTTDPATDFPKALRSRCREYAQSTRKPHCGRQGQL